VSLRTILAEVKAKRFRINRAIAAVERLGGTGYERIQNARLQETERKRGTRTKKRAIALDQARKLPRRVAIEQGARTAGEQSSLQSLPPDPRRIRPTVRPHLM